MKKHEVTEPKRQENDKIKTRILKKGLLALGAFLLLSSIGIAVFIWSALGGNPEWDPAKLDDPVLSSVVYDKDNNVIANLNSTEYRLPFVYEDMPDLMVQTIVAVEDKTFFEHMGVDVMRLVKYLVRKEPASGQPESSGSTITMQLVKNTLMSVNAGEKTSGIKRKIQEVSIARKIEQSYTKEEILTHYMTHIYFGHGAYGVRSAAQVYFGKELDQLTVPEVAMLCGLPAAPSGFDPYLNEETAKERRTYVLSVMRDDGLITEREFELYKDEPFTFVGRVQAGEISLAGVSPLYSYPYFVDYVVDSLLEQYGFSEYQVFNGGLHIYTTVDLGIQQAAEAVMSDQAHYPSADAGSIRAEGALVMLDHATGNVVALMGGREYPKNQRGVFNRASRGKRMAGSLAQSVAAYAPALEHGGYTPDSLLDDSPVQYGDWSPRNFDMTYRGTISMREAVRDMVNVAAVRLYAQVGPDVCWNFAKSMGIDGAATDAGSLSNALGSFEVTALEMARAYSAFANRGMLNQIRCISKITDADGQFLWEPEQDSRRVMTESTASQMSDMLRGAVTDGAGREADISGQQICGQVGVAAVIDGHMSDVWFAGYGSGYTAVVWMGYDVNDAQHQLSWNDRGRPAVIWRQVMEKALEGK